MSFEISRLTNNPDLNRLLYNRPGPSRSMGRSPAIRQCDDSLPQTSVGVPESLDESQPPPIRMAVERSVSAPDSEGTAESEASSSALVVDPQAAPALSGSVQDRVEVEAFAALAARVARMMGDSEILTEAFFQDHPRAAIYLIRYPDERRRLAASNADQLEFRTHVARYESLINAAALARNLAGADFALGPDLRSRGKSSATLDFLESQAHLARLINENPDFAKKLALDETAGRLFSRDTERLKSILQACSSGLPDQDDTSG